LNKDRILEPFVKEAFPGRPWQKVGIDLFKLETWYLVIVHYYSRYFEICQLKTLTEQEIITKCRETFARYGIPNTVRSDCGTQFASEFRRFAKKYDFEHVTSSLKYSQSNGAAKAAVKVVKSILKKMQRGCIYLGLLAHRTTSLENGYTPVELMFSRKIRSRLPMLPSKLGSLKNHSKVSRKETERKEKQERNYNKRHRSKSLSKLKRNSGVWVTDLRVYAKVVKPDRSPNSYIIRTKKGSVLRRNRWHLIPAPYIQGNNRNSNDDPMLIEDDNDSIVTDDSNYESALIDDVNEQPVEQDASSASGKSDSNLQRANELRKSERIKRPSTRLRDFFTF